MLEFAEKMQREPEPEEADRALPYRILLVYDESAWKPAPGHSGTTVVAAMYLPAWIPALPAGDLLTYQALEDSFFITRAK